jgi:Uma2 family endonuclease
MAMVAHAKRWTLDELHRLPDDGNKYEVVFGELFVTPAPSRQHETILARLHSALAGYVETHGIGTIFRPRAVVRFEGSEAEPDLFVCPRPPREKDETLDWGNAPAPLLVVEVLSPATRRRDLGPKRQFYLMAGVGEYWVIDPERRDIRVIRAGRADEIVDGTITWSPGPAEPLSLSVGALF